MRRYRRSVDDIAADRETPSRNTVKRALRREAVFLNTVDRIWDFLQQSAAEKRETLSDLRRGQDYEFIEGAPKTAEHTLKPSSVVRTDGRRGWLSRQVPRRNRLFTGRTEELGRLHNAIKAGPAALVSDPQALTGLGGIGKTQTAAAYIYQYWTEYSHICWVSAESVEDLNDGLASLADELNLLDSAHATKNASLRKVHDWFQKESGWLLVLDNVDDIETLAPFFPRHHTGSLLLTTRSRGTVKWAAPIELEKFGGKEGALLMLRRAGMLAMSQTLEDAPPNVVNSVIDLSVELDGLPLALDQAGAYITEAGVSPSDYLDAYRKQGLLLLDQTVDSDHKSVSVTFRLALEDLAKRGAFGPAAVEMVQLCAFLAPDAIPDAIFRAYVFSCGDPSSPLSSPELYRNACAAASGYSLVNRSSKSGTISIHRLIQAVTREAMSEGDRRDWAERAVHAVAEATPDFELEDWPLCDQLLPHWRLCAEYIKDLRIATQMSAYLLYQAGRYLRARAQFGEAEKLLRYSIEIAEKVHGASHETTAEYLDGLACLYREIDRLDEAAPLHERALTIVEAVFGSEHPETAAKLHNMALYFSMRQDHSRAEALFKRVIAIRESELPPNWIMVATASTQLGGVYRSSERFREAEDCYRRALAIYVEALPPNHIDIATGCNNLGLLYVKEGRLSEAEPLLLRAMKINEEVRGTDHPQTGVVAWGLALVRWKQDRNDEAEAFFLRAMRIYERAFGREHSEYVRLSGQYAQFQNGFAN